MLVFRYSKLDGAEFISHLDTLRHLQKILIRAKIPVEYSKGYNPHMLIYLSAPLGVGVKSRAEYCAVETDFNAEEFIDLFNKNAPAGFRCISAINSTKKVNLQAQMDSAEYLIQGVNDFDLEKVLGEKEFFVTDKRGENKEVRDRILNLKKTDNGLIALLSFGNSTLRPDVLGERLIELFGGENLEVEKLNAFIIGVKPEEAYR